MCLYSIIVVAISGSRITYTGWNLKVRLWRKNGVAWCQIVSQQHVGLSCFDRNVWLIPTNFTDWMFNALRVTTLGFRSNLVSVCIFYTVKKRCEALYVIYGVALHDLIKRYFTVRRLYRHMPLDVNWLDSDGVIWYTILRNSHTSYPVPCLMFHRLFWARRIRWADTRQTGQPDRNTFVLCAR